MVQFRELNLLADLRPLGRFDIVFCRNVLIYFDQATKTRVLEAIAAQMPPDGLLYLGGRGDGAGHHHQICANADGTGRLHGRMRQRHRSPPWLEKWQRLVDWDAQALPRHRPVRSLLTSAKIGMLKAWRDAAVQAWRTPVG